MIHLRWAAFTALIVSIGYLAALFAGKTPLDGAMVGLAAASLAILITEAPT